MKNRRSLLLGLAMGAMALSVIVLPAIADELFGVVTKVDIEGKKITVSEKETDKDVVVTTTDSTEVVTPNGETRKLDLEKLSKTVAKIQEKGKKGVRVVVTHEKGVASSIKYQIKKKAE